jgi:hypothetical protein
VDPRVVRDQADARSPAEPDLLEARAETGDYSFHRQTEDTQTVGGLSPEGQQSKQSTTLQDRIDKYGH